MYRPFEPIDDCLASTKEKLESATETILVPRSNAIEPEYFCARRIGHKLNKADDGRIVLERSLGWKLLNATT
jgi:hypothetical protein